MTTPLVLSARPQQRQAAPPVQSNFPWSRPNTAPTASAGLNFDPAMTPRAAIATGATNADAGVYRDLATFDLTHSSGAPRSGRPPLPIELQFLTQMGAKPGDNTASFLRPLSNL
ncbi:hypothetical protein [Pelagibius sp. Alg239-R121]|uniref:hypothetical protein n=1 Tax=Pelagibius sp. Alg239-R121 TaxID=2993448 RepID=UPI0024A76CD2|nr:hypothetical protein [Pelagibius sp. Alg239-R121]